MCLICILICLYLYVHTCIYIHIHIYIYVYIYIDRASPEEKKDFRKKFIIRRMKKDNLDLPPMHKNDVLVPFTSDAETFGAYCTIADNIMRISHMMGGAHPQRAQELNKIFQGNSGYGCLHVVRPFVSLFCMSFHYLLLSLSFVVLLVTITSKLTCPSKLFQFQQRVYYLSTCDLCCSIKLVILEACFCCEEDSTTYRTVLEERFKRVEACYEKERRDNQGCLRG
jgi:hypothetical protein